MANYEIRTLQLHILNILSAVDIVCKNHNIQYYIVDGTMLGAIRHKGFIPWDDDIDIGMPRKDYDLFMKNAKEWLPAPYELVCGENNGNYPLPFAKVQDSDTTLIERDSFLFMGGVYIDIFPLDGVPKSKFRQKLHMRRYLYCKKILYFMSRDPYKHGKGFSSWFTKQIHNTFTISQVQRLVKNVQKKYDYEKHEYCINYDDGIKSIMPKRILGKPTPVVFEERTFMGVEHYDEYLTKIYGNYMEIPSVEKRIQHNFHYLNLHQSYRNQTKSFKELINEGKS